MTCQSEQDFLTGGNLVSLETLPAPEMERMGIHHLLVVAGIAGEDLGPVVSKQGRMVSPDQIRATRHKTLQYLGNLVPEAGLPLVQFVGLLNIDPRAVEK